MIFKVGDRVYCSYHKQCGIIKTTSVYYFKDIFSYRVDFPDGNYAFYTREGQLIGHPQITLKLTIKDKINKLLKIK